MHHHAFAVEAGAEQGIAVVQAFLERDLGLVTKANPDVIILRYGLFSVDDARRVNELASGSPLAGKRKAVVIAAFRASHEAQNALLKLFEEPPPETFLFLVMPSLGGIVETLRSRILELPVHDIRRRTEIPATARAFIEGTKQARSAMIKKLSGGKDEDDRGNKHEEALQIVDGIEIAAYEALRRGKDENVIMLLRDTERFREYLHDRGAPIRIILEHLSLVLPKGLL